MLTETGTKRGDLLKQYVTARIVRMNGIDIGLFDYDRYNTLYFFILNADEHIYMRYGGRDQRSPTTYLDLESLELALGARAGAAPLVPGREDRPQDSAAGAVSAGHSRTL